MNKNTTLDMTEGKVIRVLLVFTIPIFISNLFQQFYNVVDVAVIGHILGDNALAAVGATSSIYSLVIGFINGMSNGFCIIIARYFGGNEQDNFQKSVQFSIILSIITTVILTIASILFLKPLLRLLNTPVDILDLSQSYILVIMLETSCNCQHSRTNRKVCRSFPAFTNDRISGNLSDRADYMDCISRICAKNQTNFKNIIRKVLKISGGLL